ncbi:MAG TPA: adenylate/guanylate cyclase domain-containing protein [Pirellulales bacterium]
MALLRITDANGTTVRELEGPAITIGRGPGNQIILRDLAASSRHAQIVKSGDDWQIEDRGSLNKTFLNGVEVQASKLKSGDRILIGATELLFEMAPAPAIADTVPAVKGPSSPGYASSFLQSVAGDHDQYAGEMLHPMMQSLVIDDESEEDSASNFSFLRADGGSVEHDVRTMMFATQLKPPSSTGSAISALKPGETVAEIKLRLIQRVGDKLVRIFDPKQLMDEIMSIVIESSGADRGVLCLMDDQQLPVPFASHGLGAGEQVRLSRTVLKRVFAERSGVLINQGGGSGSNIYRSLAEMKVHSTLCVPLWTGDKIIGLLSLDSVREERTFTQQDLDVLLAIAHQAAIGIERGRMSQAIESERQMRSYLSKYLDNRIVERISQRSDGVDPLAPAERVVTVLFSDIVSFTKISEGLKPAQVGEFLREYLTAMTEIIFAHGGTIDKYIGDAVMALFGAPVPSKDSATSAIRAALEMRERIRKFAPPGMGDQPLRVRFGINTGLVVVGNFGSARRTEYTAIGDAVNVASRLQTFARPNEICIDEETYAKTDGAFVVEEIGTVDVKNRAQPIAVFKVLRAK